MIIYNLIPSLCYFWLWRTQDALQQYSFVWCPPFLRSLIQQIQCIPCRRLAVVAKSCYYKVGYSICTALVMRQVGIYTADLRFVYQVNKKQEFPADRWKMKISWKPLLKCMWCAILIAQWKHWYTKLERCVLDIFPVIGRVIPARTIQPLISSMSEHLTDLVQ